MITTSIRDLRDLANHFSGIQINSSATGNSTAGVNSVGSVTSTVQTLHPQPGVQTPPLPRSSQQSIVGHSEAHQQHHHHHRSVVADVPFFQGVHKHAPSSSGAYEADERRSTGGRGGGSATMAPPTQGSSNLRDLLIQTIHKKVVGRLIIVGDVHGCPDQLRDLMKLLHYDRTIDLLIIAGDLVNKGPDSHGAVRAAMELGALCVLGNHDATVLELHEQIKANELDPFSRKTSRDPAVRVAREMTDDCVEYLQSLPHIIKIPQYQLMVLHAGLNISYSLEDQSIRDLTHLRRLDWNHERQRYDSIAKGSDGELWATLYNGPETVVFGHDARTGLQDERFAIGLDTGCCYGGPLTAVVFPGRKFHSVPGLPRENRLRTEEDLDETASRLDTPSAPVGAPRDTSPAPSSFYDPISLSSNRSTPYSTTMPGETAFPNVPSVQQLFQKAKSVQQPLSTSTAPPPAASASSLSQQQQQPGGASIDPISYLRNFAGATSSTPATSSSVKTTSGSAGPAESTSPSSTIAPHSSSSTQPSRRRTPPPQEAGSDASSVKVQVATLQTLVAGQHARAILSLLQTDLYRSAWESLLEAPSSSSTSPPLLENERSFWSGMIEMIVTFTDREKTLSDDVLELTDLLLEILAEKRESIASRAIARVQAFASRLESGELKGVSKGVLKAIQTLLK